MKRAHLSAFCLSCAIAATSQTAFAQSDSDSSWMRDAWHTASTHVSDTWRDGDIELYAPLYTWHLPFAYRKDLRDSYTTYPGGIGLGKGRYNASGNWEGMYAMGFRDSHGDPSFMVGYGWIPTWELGRSEVKVGVGVTGFIMSRRDYLGGFPFPAALPIASVSYKNLSLQAAYIPGGRNNGNVVFVWGKWTFR